MIREFPDINAKEVSLDDLSEDKEDKESKVEAILFDAFSQDATLDGDAIGDGAGKKGIAGMSEAEGGLWIDGPDILRESSTESTAGLGAVSE